MEQMDRKTVLHLLRNPWGWSDEVVREARLKAADELQRLWQLEGNCAAIAKELHAELVPNDQVSGRATMIDETKTATEPPLDCRVRATISLCCGVVRAGWKEPAVMHTGMCSFINGGKLGHTYYLTDSGLTMDACGVMRSNAGIQPSERSEDRLE